MNNFTLQPIPHLGFNGNCSEAFDFYAHLFGGKIVSKTTYAEFPPEMAFPDEAKGLIGNEMLELPGGAMLYGGDTPPGMSYTPMAGLMITINFPTIEQAQHVFDALADNGEVMMPFAPTFWAEKFGFVTDKYGVRWGVNGNLGPSGK